MQDWRRYGLNWLHVNRQVRIWIKISQQSQEEERHKLLSFSRDVSDVAF